MMMASSQSPPPDSSTSNNNGANSGNISSTSKNGNPASKKPAQVYLTNCKSLYSCIYCRTHLANHDELVSRGYQGSRTRAYLFNSVVNVKCGRPVMRQLNTGSHSVADISCMNCNKTLGWKYEKAYVMDQKFKEGKYILELAHVVRENRHLEFDKGELFFERNRISLTGSRRLLANPANNNNNHSRYSLPSQASINHHHQSSLTPSPGGGHWSSSVASSSSNNEEVTGGSHHYNYDDDDDEELMFPFYDDICTGRSSYPSYLSSSRHNRMRRSLYLESTPYDWKYATNSASSFSPSANEKEASATCYLSEGQPKMTPAIINKKEANFTPESSLADSGLSDISSSSPSPSSSSDASHKQKQISYQNESSNNNNSTNNNSKYVSKGKGRNDSERETDNDDTQFKFEADRPEQSVDDSSTRSAGGEQQIEHCDQLYEETTTKIVGCRAGQHRPLVVGENSASSDSNRNLSEIEKGWSRDHQLPSASSSSSHLSSLDDDDDDIDGGNPISSESDEFFDCYTDHENLGVMVESESSSTLRIVE